MIGGHVYRGPVTNLQGHYFFADNLSGQVWSLTSNGTGFSNLTNRTAELRPNAGSINRPASFGEDHDGNLYIVDLDGDVFRVIEKVDWPGF